MKFCLIRSASLSSWLSAARWPGQLLSTDHMDVQVVDALASVCSIVDNRAVPSFMQILLLGNFRANDHHVTKDCSVSFFSFWDSCKAISILRDHQEVSLCDWADIAECQALFVFVDYGCRDLLLDDFVEDCDFFCCCSLSLCLFAFYHFFLLTINKRVYW